MSKVTAEYGKIENPEQYLNYMQFTYPKDEDTLRYYVTHKGKMLKVVSGEVEYVCKIINAVMNDKIKVLLGVVDIKATKKEDKGEHLSDNI